MEHLKVILGLGCLMAVVHCLSGSGNAGPPYFRGPSPSSPYSSNSNSYNPGGPYFGGLYGYPRASGRAYRTPSPRTTTPRSTSRSTEVTSTPRPVNTTEEVTTTVLPYTHIQETTTTVDTTTTNGESTTTFTEPTIPPITEPTTIEPSTTESTTEGPTTTESTTEEPTTTILTTQEPTTTILTTEEPTTTESTTEEPTTTESTTEEPTTTESTTEEPTTTESTTEGPSTTEPTPTATPTTESTTTPVNTTKPAKRNRCRYDRQGETTPVTGVCFAYHLCFYGELVYQECDLGYRFDARRRRCVRDSKCATACPPWIYPDHYNNATFFLGGQMRYCADGTYFSYRSCTCVQNVQYSYGPYREERVTLRRLGMRNIGGHGQTCSRS